MQGTAPARPRLFFGWYIVFAGVAINFYLSLVYFQGFQLFFLPILQEFGWSRAATSGAFSLRQMESGIMAPVVGLLVDRMGARTIIVVGVLLTGAGLLLLAFVNSLWMFYAGFMIASVGASGASHGVSWPVLVAAWFRRQRGRAMGMVTLGPVVGGPCLVLVAMLVDAIGWRQSLLILALGTWVVGLPLGLLARRSPEAYGLLPDGDAPAAGSAAAKRTRSTHYESWGVSTRDALRSKPFWVIAMLFGVQGLGMSGLMVHLVPLLEDAHYSATLAAGALGALFLLSGIGRVGAGMLLDRADQRVVIVGMLVLQAAAMLLLTVLRANQLWLVVLFVLLLGPGFGGMVPLRPLLIRQRFGPRSFGSINGFAQGIAIGTGVMGPVLYGYIFDRVGSYDLALYLSALAVAASVPFGLALGKRQEIATPETSGTPLSS